MVWKHEWVERLLGKYILVRNYCGSGFNHIAWIINAFKLGGYVILFLIFLGIDTTTLPAWSIPVFSITFLIATGLLGWIWDKYKGYEIEAEFGNKRNKLAQEIREKFK